MSTVKLNSGASIPTVGYGIGTAWYGRSGVNAELRDAIVKAIDVGYTHLDSGEVYANAESFAAALSATKTKREDLWITEKILPGMADIPGTLKKQLSTLGLDYVDLYLLHGPEKLFPKGSPSQAEAWQQLEQLQAAGLAKNIGISNHRVEDIEKILKIAKVVPAVNQIELHPYVWKEAKEIVDFCHEKGIKIQAYSPTAPLVHYKGGPVDAVVDDVAKSLGERAGKSVTPGQVLLKWAAQKGDISVTTSSKEDRMGEQLAIVSLPALNDEELKAIEDAGLKSEVKRKYMVEVFK